tara:strand:- start:108 stop:443 length:336 start_codon:yes stop_codon:yes gene_type:complete
MTRPKWFNKKGFEFLTNWVLIFFIAILVLSFLLAIVIINVWVTFVIVLFAGVLLGHFIFTSKEGNRFPYYLLSFAFISGYLAGHKVGNAIIILVLFIGAIVATNKVMQYSK